MIVKAIPKGNPSKSVECSFCLGKSTIKDILAHNRISDLSEGVFDGWE
jgi:hypothetical protein